MMMRTKSVFAGTVLSVSLLLSGCCSNYSTYSNSMASDLESLDPVYRGYVERDDRLSDADRAARLSILEEMRAKTKLAQEDSQ